MVMLFGGNTGRIGGANNTMREAEMVSEGIVADTKRMKLFMEAETSSLLEDGQGGEILEATETPTPTNEEEAKAAEAVNEDTAMAVTTEDVSEPQTSEGLETPEISTEGEVCLQTMAEQITSEIAQGVQEELKAPLTDTPVVVSAEEGEEVTVDTSKDVETGSDVDASEGATAAETIASGDGAETVGDIKVEVNVG